MVTDPAAQLLLSALFVLTVVWFAGQAVRARARAERVGHALHLVMGLSMLAMTWAWGSALPVWPQVALFAAATGWFVLVALLPAGHPTQHSSAPWLPWFHVVMTAAMVWMLLVGQGGHDHSQPVQGAVPTTSGLVLLVLLLAGTALSVTTAVHTDRPRRRGRPGFGWDVGHAAMGLGMVAMTAPVLLA